MSLFEISLKQNFFNFDNNTYQQADGLAMGSPLSPLLADIYMDDFESKFIMNNNNFSNNIIYYYRYVDDILVLWNNDQDNLNSFVDYLNSCHTKIKFTLEKQNNNNSINFLDITITNLNNKHTFDIFRKTSHTGVVLHNSSEYPYSHKMAAFHSYINRALNIPLLPESYNREIKIIKQIAIEHGYNSRLIDKLILTKQNHNLTRVSYPNTLILNQPKKYHTLTYNGPLSYKIAKILQNHNFLVSFRTGYSLSSFILNNKDKIDITLRSGIYKLNCSSCSAYYIGRTYRNFKIRFSEHARGIRNNCESSLFAKHILDSGHNFDIKNNFQILHLQNKSTLLNNLEILEITRHINTDNLNCLNAQIQFDTSPLFNILFE